MLWWRNFKRRAMIPIIEINETVNSNGKITRCVKTITILGAQIYKRTGSYPEEQERIVGFTSTENFLNYVEDD